MARAFCMNMANLPPSNKLEFASVVWGGDVGFLSVIRRLVHNTALLAARATEPTHPALRTVTYAPKKLEAPQKRPDAVPTSEVDLVLEEIRRKNPLVLVHGRAGTGKTTLVRSLAKRGLRHVIVAPTGVAALNAGGQTVHKFFGIPPTIVDLDGIHPNQRLKTILRRLDFLVIDEISMVRADLLDVVDRTLRVNLEVDKPFGGLPLLLVGDFLQLPPVVTDQDAEILKNRGYEVAHAFGAKSFRNIPVRIIDLDTVHRQKDPEFIRLLGNLRSGADLEATVDAINDRCHRLHRTSAKPVILTSRTAAAEVYNKTGLETLKGRPKQYRGIIKQDFRVDKDRLPAPEFLTLKVGARVMLVKNDPDNRWVNGSLAEVVKLTADGVWVKLDRDTSQYQVHPVTWESFEYRYDPATQRANPVVVGTYTQIPLQLAWAMTIHKAQGLTIEDVRIDLGPGAFSSGQTYVALSRATTMDGLSLHTPLRISDVKADLLIVDALEKLKSRVVSRSIRPTH